MKAILLDGSLANDSTGVRVRSAVGAELKARGWDVELIVLRERRLTPCAGDFSCWIRTPGLCVIDDDNRAIAAAIVTSDLLVYLTPVTFGGYSSALKSMVDHQIQLISPFFAEVEGETHHHKRYEKYPDLLAVGWLDAPDAQAETVFRHLARRNALNFYATTQVSGVVCVSQPDAEMRSAAQRWLTDLESGASTPDEGLPATPVTCAGTLDVRRALLLVGSPKALKSTSHSLGSYLVENLGAACVRTETMCLHSALRSPAGLQALLEAVDAADLVVLASPLYADSLPAPTIAALERIAAYRRGRAPVQRQLFTVIATCGFPEAQHCATALAIGGTFARQAGFEWPGALAVGGRVLNGVPLAWGGWQTWLIGLALRRAAAALARGQAIPPAAQAMMALPPLPPWAAGVFRAMGGLYWVVGAIKYGALGRLKQRPYASKAR
jgi:multimeric flavodoxin WrbA